MFNTSFFNPLKQQNGPSLGPVCFAEHDRNRALLAHARIRSSVGRVPQPQRSHSLVHFHLSILHGVYGTFGCVVYQLPLQYQWLVLYCHTVCAHTRMRTGGQEEWRSGETEPSVVCAVSQKIQYALTVCA